MESRALTATGEQDLLELAKAAALQAYAPIPDTVSGLPCAAPMALCSGANIESAFPVTYDLRKA